MDREQAAPVATLALAITLALGAVLAAPDAKAATPRLDDRPAPYTSTGR
jgi:hypothetical protein